MWTIGREREKLHAAKFVRDAAQQNILFPVIDAIHDVKEDRESPAAFIAVARIAMTKGGSGVWQNTVNWIAKVAREHPEVLSLWDELALCANWQTRWRVACVLYGDISDAQSDHLFSKLRHDASKRVREMAVDRYENRPGPNRHIVFKMFDANHPASPGFERK